MSVPTYVAEFTSHLIRYPGKGGWTFAEVPPEHAPSVALHWGRTPVHATVDGYSWETSVWREKSGRTLLPIPKRARGDDDRESVQVCLEYSVKYG